MTDKIEEQIFSVRAGAECNMMDITAVQRYAFEHEMFELVCYLEDNRREYVRFIMTGKTEADEK